MRAGVTDELPADEAIREPFSRGRASNRDGIPYLVPEGVLLFKAKWTRDQGRVDFAGVCH